MFLLKKAKVLFAFLVTASTWVFQERFLEMLRSQTHLFADNCLMYRKVSSTSDCTQLQEDLDTLIKWEKQVDDEFPSSATVWVWSDKKS
jgi:hypothetical protein